jgi:hypothetical protein
VRIELRNRKWLRCRHRPNIGRQYLGVRYARASGVAGVEDQGMLSKGSPVNPGELAISSKSCALVPRIRSGTGSVGREGWAYRSEHALIEVNRSQGQPEAAVTGSRAVLQAHSTDEGGETQGSCKGRPRYPPEGRGEQMDVSTW